jgi:hypothetical protein
MKPTLELSWYLYQLHRYALALVEVMKYLSQHPESAEGHALLALIHAK